jgi:hypothetical protein
LIFEYHFNGCAPQPAAVSTQLLSPPRRSSISHVRILYFSRQSFKNMAPRFLSPIYAQMIASAEEYRDMIYFSSVFL